MRGTIIALSAAFLAACAVQEKTVTKQDPIASDFDSQAHLFLEEVEGEKALNWVRAENERSLALLETDPRYATLKQDALDIVNAKERIPYGTVRGDMVYNFWQDETNVRGLWRRTLVEDYESETPNWETVIDFDKLAEEEGKNWVYKGVECHFDRYQDKYYCMVSLSDGGKDAVVQREFDLQNKSFVEGGFVTTEAKQGAAWLNRSTLLIATDWGEGTLTESGYPYIVKEWRRGTPLEEAEEIFRGEPTDVGAWPMVLELEGGSKFPGAIRAETFFTSSKFWLGTEVPIAWPVPQKSDVQGLFKDQFLLVLKEDWAPEGQENTFRSGDLVAFDAPSFLKSRGEELPDVSLVFRPTAKQAIEGVAISKEAVLISYTDNVTGLIAPASFDYKAGWTVSPPAPLPEKGNAGIAFADKQSDTIYLNYEGFLNPDSLYTFDVAANAVEEIKSLPAKFDADPYVVEQFEAISTDGVKVPYFVVRHKETELNGDTPTLQYGYGGFQISLTPSYSPFIGKMWLDNGGAYVLANIRGGGEFGPEWHQAGLKTKRQIVYDDFISVSEDIIARGLTSSDRLGIQGGSNGGLLMGVMFTQRPDLYSAIVCQVPLLDMLRYHLLLAGASWVDEYGDPDIAEERAWLEQLSPYHNINPSTEYPEIFFVTSTKDDRVHPAHARKMAHRLQDLGKPFLYYENIDGGHSAAANLKEAAHRRALEFTYLAQKLMD